MPAALITQPPLCLPLGSVKSVYSFILKLRSARLVPLCSFYTICRCACLLVDGEAYLPTARRDKQASFHSLEVAEMEGGGAEERKQRETESIPWMTVKLW